MNALDKIIGFFSPHTGALRLQARHVMDSVEKLRRYDAAGHGRRVEDWKVGNISANRELDMSLLRIIARSRDLDRNNPYAKRAIERIADNVVGIGIRPTFSKQSVKFAKIWKAWAEGDSKECDFDGRHNLFGLQWLTMRTVAESGSAFIRKRRTSGNKKSGVPIQLQVLEPDIIDFSRNYQSIDNKNPGGYCVQGIEFWPDGRRKGYWMWEHYPSEVVTVLSSTMSKFVPVEDVIHVYQVERPGQCHGVPFGVQSFVRLKDFDDFEDAELIRQKIAACFSVFVTKSTDAVDTSGEKVTATERLEPGMIEHLSPGETVSFTNPPAKDGIDGYSRQVLQGIAAGYGTTYEALTGDMRNVNFSSGRMGWLEFQRTVNRYQYQMFIPNFCSDVLTWFKDGAVIAGVGSVDNIAADWTPPRREMIDPLKEITALSMSVRNGFQDWGEAVTELGDDPETVLDRMQKWATEFDKRGLIMDSDPRKTAAGGKFQVVPAAPEDSSATAKKPKSAKKPAKKVK